ncbi:hypothetical protein [Flavobacterium urumqiense]|uniref:Acyl-CoA dehydrogenase/long-chain-acyl-CoA dehydrogenase n=1 Tax=Flavobacterium urumqiense TaxID=935224 RepID=A0A1H5ZI73_9FLAO|nr:hypothetical protein [Flavobacterium urumqiense]SEG36168.1 acyl-CoA dehydrogenase/long-chain-acyl-CoA dehydrogenase [Flavobacterium urumqiense]
MCDMAIVAVKTNYNTDDEGITLLILESTMEEFNKGVPLKKIGMKSQDTAELFFDNVKVPNENRLGDEKMGFKITMQELARERLTVGIMAVAIAEDAIENIITH